MAKKHLIETIIFLTYAVFAMSWVAGSMMTPAIMAQYGIETLTSATWVNNAITISKIIGNLLAAWVMVRLGLKKAFALAALLISAGAIGAFASSYPMYVFSRFVMGFGGAFVIVYFAPIVLHYFSPAERPLINGINAAAFNTGNLLALLFTGSMLQQVGGDWQDLLFVISAASGALLLVWWFVGEDFDLAGESEGGKAQAYTFSDGLRERVNWVLPLAYTGVLFCYISVFALFPLVPDFAANPAHLSAIMIAAGMVGTVAGIIVTKRIARRVPAIRYSGLAMTICAGLMIATAEPLIAYAAAFLAGFFMFLPMTPLITLAQELPGMTPGRIAVVFAMFWSISYSFETALMFGAGALADMTGTISTAAVFAVACSSSLFLFSFALPETGPVAEAATA